MDMTPNKPYLIRAFYEWIVDNNLTPYLVVNASVQGCKVPQNNCLLAARCGVET